MAFITINNSEFQRKLYTGYAPVKVLAVNPNKEELEKYFGPQQNDPIYITTTNVNGKDVPQVRIDFILEAKRPDSTGTFYSRLSFYLTRGYTKNKADTKFEVIDKYGRTTWASNEDVQNKRIPVFDNGQRARIDVNYRPLIIGEDRLIKFIRALFCLNDPERWDTVQNCYVVRDGDDLARCEGILDNTKDFFNGDYSELVNIVKMAENNTVYALFGVTTKDGARQYQTIYNSGFVKKNRRKESIDKDFNKALDEFYPNNASFDICPLKEYNVKPTDFGAIAEAPEKADDMPDADATDDLPFADNWNI